MTLIDLFYQPKLGLFSKLFEQNILTELHNFTHLFIYLRS